MTAPRPAVLLDGNILVALAYPQHIHHQAARQWFRQHAGPFATCPITQGTLLRMLLHHGAVPQTEDALAVLRGFVGHPRHCFWADTLGYLDVGMHGVIGHRQVTDAYLAALARAHGGRLATFDKGLAALHPDVAELVAQ
ncbi:MAG: PIN domain-containing protein [Acidovorax sp.]|uniref:TA system VapC family ribonuclease toxin n=1 Tax=Acidovorax sp. TaxID=1872122 RepID=UPI0039E6B598